MQIQVGQIATLTRTFTQDDFNRFAKLSGDDNPIHVDPDFAARSRFGKMVSHGMLLYSVLCGALNKHFPGAEQVEQELMFPTPTFVGEEITVRLQVKEVDDANRTARLDTIITRPNGDVALQGVCSVRFSALFRRDKSRTTDASDVDE